MKYTMYNLWSLLREAVQQVQEERKESSNLRGQVAQLESEVLACHQIISQLLIRVWNFIFVFKGFHKKPKNSDIGIQIDCIYANAIMFLGVR